MLQMILLNDVRQVIEVVRTTSTRQHTSCLLPWKKMFDDTRNVMVCTIQMASRTSSHAAVS